MNSARAALVFSLLIAVTATTAFAQTNDDALSRKSHEILGNHCFRCHGERGSKEGGFSTVLDRRVLVARKHVIPGDSANSILLQRIVNGSMPADAQPLPAEEIDTLRRWIDAGAPDFVSEAARPFITPTAVFELIRADLEKQNERSRPFLRYFTLTHLYNAGLSDADLEITRQGLSKAVNSLSFGHRIVVPKAVDPMNSVLRVDLRDYTWTSATWDKLIAKNPYRLEDKSPAALAARFMTNTSEPALRGDWFIAVGTVPPLYHDILGIPKTDRELEQRLQVDVEQNLKDDRAARAGFNNSGVSRNNRMIERHDSQFGAYWKSYDFSGNSGLKNLFAHPLGPKGKNAFEHDGGEIIFNLPNGLQGYMLVDNKGNRIDKGPTAIVSDPKRPDRAVVNGLSCMACHTAGTIAKGDQVRDAVLRVSGAFDPTDLESILAQYRPKDEMDKLFAEDSERFTKALAKAGIPQAKTDPVLEVALRFEKEMDVRLAASEAGLPVRDFVRGIERTDDLARAFGPLKVDGGTVQREVFQANFTAMVRDFALGREQILNSIGMMMVGIPEGEFQMGSLKSDKEAQDDEFPQHRVRISKAFYIGAHEVTVEQFRRFAQETGFKGGGGYKFNSATGKFVLSSQHTFANTGMGQNDDHPVVNVSWNDAVAFCEWLSKKEGVTYRLPTEAEWEFVCRAGTRTRFSTGETDDSIKLSANTNDANLGKLLSLASPAAYNDRFAMTAPVGSYRPNGFGTFDMHGNVWEWCSDWYNRDAYKTSAGTDPQGPAEGTFKVVRGGCWAAPLEIARSADRTAFQPTDRNLMIGFRVVREGSSSSGLETTVATRK